MLTGHSTHSSLLHSLRTYRGDRDRHNRDFHQRRDDLMLDNQRNVNTKDIPTLDLGSFGTANEEGPLTISIGPPPTMEQLSSRSSFASSKNSFMPGSSSRRYVIMLSRIHSMSPSYLNLF